MANTKNRKRGEITEIEFQEWDENSALPASEFEKQIAFDISQFYDDFHGFVIYAFPWKQKDTELEGHSGPDKWQKAQQLRVSEKVRSDPEGTIREAIASGHGIGKALCNETPIPTPNGFRLMGELRRGDKVFSVDGKPTTVMRVMPQGVTKAYRMTFNDGSSVVCNPEHVWTVKGRQQRRNNKPWIELTAQELFDHGTHRSNGGSQARQWEIPQQHAAEFEHTALPMDAYTLGVWLGDGGAGSARITSADREVTDRIAVNGQAIHKTTSSYAWYLAGLSAPLKQLGMYWKRSWEKFIPDIVKFNDRKTRLAVLQGLLDTDGEVAKHGSIGFCSTSKQLAEDVIYLARSLGAFAKMQPSIKYPSYNGPDGEKLPGRPAYRVSIMASKSLPLFTIRRKEDRRIEPEARYLKRWIDKIEAVDDRKTTCITVSNPDGLFQCTKDFIVTHNSAEVAWLILWAMSTRPHLAGVITANTTNQLNTKTWRELALWHKRAINSHWFKWTATRFFHVDHPETWFCSATPNTEHNSEAFAGLHGTHVLIIYDEASGVPDKIWEVSEGAMTDPRAMWFVYGNPTRNTGKFRDIFMNDPRWTTHQIDSRTCKMTNKKEIAAQIAIYGEDHDFTRVRIKGQFPRAGSMQFIASNVCDTCMLTELPYESFFQLPIVLGVDVARFGEDKSVIAVRQGRKVLELLRFRDMDTMMLAAKVVTAIRNFRPAAVFVDGVGIGAGVVDRLRMLGHDIIEVNAGMKPDDDKTYYNKRAEMWDRMRIQMAAGMDIPNDADLRNALIGIEYGFDDKERMRLERKQDMKKRGLESPDDADAIAYTFAELIGDTTMRYFESDDAFEPEMAA